MEFNEFRNLKFNVFGDRSHFKGEMELKGDVTIASKVEGTINAEDETLITIERSAKVKGILNGHDIEIFGTFDGELNAKGRLIIRSSAKVKGNIQAEKLCIYPGAILDMEAHTKE